MRLALVSMMLAAIQLLAAGADAQVVLTGRVLHPRHPGSEDLVPLSTILCFANVSGSQSEPGSFRTWETEPVGWFRVWGRAGNYTLVFANPAHFMRPLVLTNVVLRPGEQWKQNVTPALEFYDFEDRQWDKQPATDYWQLFTARGSSATQVGFKLVHDGMDGMGPGKQDLVVSIHRRGPGRPDSWKQIGPAMPVLEVDSGGAKNYLWSAGWNSGEVPLKSGETYAVHLRTKKPGGHFQAFWRAIESDSECCYRRGSAGPQGYQRRRLWLAVATDGDGLLIPYNKRVHRQFGRLTNRVAKWSQTYVARGHGLASVILYAAVSGAQPPLSRQRVVVRVRKGGPDGSIVGIEKVAVGNGNYTGDASWGMFGAVFAPGEVPLEPGAVYAIEFESIEDYETLHGFVNIKGEVSDGKPGFNPYRKHQPDRYPLGTAFRLGKDPMDFDLDMQVIEYQRAADRWSQAVHAENLLANGDVQAGPMAGAKRNGAPVSTAPGVARSGQQRRGSARIDAWEQFAIDPDTAFGHVADGAEPSNLVARVLGGSATGKTADGGYVQRVDGLSAAEPYRLSGRVRASWPVDEHHQTYVGFDPTGQAGDPRAGSITWTVLPTRHGAFLPYLSRPIRPVADSISVWLRGRTTSTAKWPYKADFDDFALRRVRTDVPG
ncbi:MAG: hypothetical protein ACYSWU_12520, partial [Planctomycetota bacterium]